MSVPDSRLLVIGLDSATPRFVFGPHAFDLPHLRGLMESGTWGRLRSCDPPITVPAWACMTTGADPGMLGCYGFRNRRDHSYGSQRVATSLDLSYPRLWDVLSEAGHDVVVVGVPQTYPVHPVRGVLTAGLLAPDRDCIFTHPPELAAELAKETGDYIFDVEGFRTNDKEWLAQEIFRFAKNRFDVAEYLMGAKPWDFFMMVEMGLDRLHHGFWQFADPDHPLHEPGNPYENVIGEYYAAMDVRIGELIEKAGEGTAVMALSDHGARALQGGIRINQWLLDQGYLALKEAPASPVRLEDCPVDWSKTRAWASGGYCGRIFINVHGREPEGVVEVEEYEALREELAGRIEAMPGPTGAPLGNRVLKPEEIYRETRGIPPDLLVYFGDLGWRALAEVGHRGIYGALNDTGPDGANHDYDGILIYSDERHEGRGELSGMHLMDVAPTVLDFFGLPRPSWMGGRPLFRQDGGPAC